MFLSRRQFLKVSAGTVAAAAIADKALALTALQPVIEVGNPLGEYPDRSWERVYHDQYRYDSSFTWCLLSERYAWLSHSRLCAERRRHAGGAELRSQTYEDLYGNRGTFAHNPADVFKGLYVPSPGVRTLSVKGAVDAEGWKEWMDAGSPELTPEISGSTSSIAGIWTT